MRRAIRSLSLTEYTEQFFQFDLARQSSVFFMVSGHSELKEDLDSE